MLYYLKKLDKINLKKEYYDKIYKEHNRVVRKVEGKMCFKKIGPPLKDYYA